MHWLEYQRHERFVQRHPWYWQMVLKEDMEKDESPILGPDGKPVDKIKIQPKKKKKPKSKKKQDKEYRRIVVEETLGASQGDSHY